MLFLLNNWKFIVIGLLIAGLCFFAWESRERGFAIESMKTTIAQFAQANEQNQKAIADLQANAQKDLQVLEKQHAKTVANLNALMKKQKEIANAKERDAAAAPVLNDAVKFLREHASNH